jgi:TusA-related sulfurtransferase
MVAVSEILDLRGNPCPGNLPKILIALESMDDGDILEVIVDDIIALDRIPEAIREEPNYKMLDPIINGHNIHLFIKVY